MRRPAVFDDIPRPDCGSPHQGEGAFSYLNRSGRVEADRVRTLVKEWLSYYPADLCPAMISRLRSTNDHLHLSAFFELFVHQLMLTRGQHLIEVEPRLGHTGKSPDFLFGGTNGERFYVECILATGRSDQEVAEDNRLNAALKVIDETEAPGHFLNVTVEGKPAVSLSTKSMKQALIKWIAGLPAGETSSELLPFVHDEHGVRITVRVWPRDNQGQPGNSIGMRWFSAQVIDTAEDVRSALGSGLCITARS